MKRTMKCYKQEMKKLRVAVNKAKKENADLRQYVSILHHAVTSKEFMVFRVCVKK